MTRQEIIQKIEPELGKAVAFFRQELGKIRTGQASPSLVEDIQVDLFGQVMPLKHLAAISCPERRQIVIQPWDRSYLEPLEKALQKANLGIQPVVDKDLIRLSLPSLTEEYRQNLLKLLSERAEKARQTMRHWRDQAWGEIQEAVRSGLLREDDKFKGKEELQKLIDKQEDAIDSLLEQKKRELAP